MMYNQLNQSIKFLYSSINDQRPSQSACFVSFVSIQRVANTSYFFFSIAIISQIKIGEPNGDKNAKEAITCHQQLIKNLFRHSLY